MAKPEMKGKNVPMFTTRAALLLLIAAVVGGAAFLLAYPATKKNGPAAALVGFGAAAGALVTFNPLIG